MAAIYLPQTSAGPADGRRCTSDAGGVDHSEGMTPRYAPSRRLGPTF